MENNKTVLDMIFSGYDNFFEAEKNSKLYNKEQRKGYRNDNCRVNSRKKDVYENISRHEQSIADDKF